MSQPAYSNYPPARPQARIRDEHTPKPDPAELGSYVANSSTTATLVSCGRNYASPSAPSGSDNQQVRTGHRDFAKKPPSCGRAVASDELIPAVSKLGLVQPNAAPCHTGLRAPLYPSPAARPNLAPTGAASGDDKGQEWACRWPQPRVSWFRYHLNRTKDRY